ncbi:MAG: DUF6290 family protein [Novosphingobium sp.]|nr:DUF6290 family protein [Novosphingobium sp.]
MAYISVRLPDEAKTEFEQYAKFYGKKISDIVREMIIEILEDEEDMQAVMEYEKEKANGDLKTYTVEEVANELGITLND